MKRKTTTLLSLPLLGILLSACSGGAPSNLIYPDRGYADSNSDSWTQIEEGDGDVSIKWFVNMSSWGTAATANTKVGRKIYEKTGIKINFVTPISDDGSQLSTMISSGKLPDVITLSAGSDIRIQLGEENYTYPIEMLAEKYAPSLLPRLSNDVKSYFKQSDGKIHGLPNHFYTQDDLAAYQEQEGRNLMSNGSFVVRKDYIESYMQANPTAIPTTPSGFKAMAQWVKQHYSLSNSNPTVMLDHFSSTGSNAILWLQEYFNAAPEDSSGNLTNIYEQSHNKELYLWLNDLYRSNLISSTNLTSGEGALGSYIARGMPLAFVGSSQLYVEYFKQAYQSGIEYVPLAFTNEQGEVPLLRSLAGNGWLHSMITNKCSRPDRVIKLFDYLWSEEGQSLFYGLKDEDFSYTVEPGQQAEKVIGGETKNVTFKYGLIEYSDQVWTDIKDENTGNYGFGYSNILVNPMYPRLTAQKGEVLNTFSDYIGYNLKAAMADYTYTHNAFEYTRDATKKNFTDIINKSNNITNLWGLYTPRVISATSEEQAENIYDSTVNQMKSMGSKDVLASDNVEFQANKRNLGVEFAWPKNDPDSDYHHLTITSMFGNTSYNLDIPEELK